MTIRTEKITALLHETRATTWSADKAMELAHLLNEVTTYEKAIAVMEYSRGLLLTSRNILQFQITAAVAEAERDSHTGDLH